MHSDVCRVFTGMYVIPEQTLISLWASWSTLKRSNRRCSPRPPSCWGSERLTNRSSALWWVCSPLCHAHTHYKKSDKLYSFLTGCHYRVARGRSGLSNTRAVHAADQTPPKGKHSYCCAAGYRHIHSDSVRVCVSLGFRWRNMSLQRGLPTGRKLAVIWVSPTQPADHWCDPPTKQVRSDVNKCLLVFFGYINIQHVQPVCKEY